MVVALALLTLATTTSAKSDAGIVDIPVFTVRISPLILPRGETKQICVCRMSDSFVSGYVINSIPFLLQDIPNIREQRPLLANTKIYAQSKYTSCDEYYYPAPISSNSHTLSCFQLRDAFPRWRRS